jgi:hypothetical protein
LKLKRAVAEQAAIEKKVKKSKKEVSEQEETTVSDEPTYELEVQKDYDPKHNCKEFTKVFKAEFKRLGTQEQNAENLVEALKNSPNIRELFALAAKIFN